MLTDFDVHRIRKINPGAGIAVSDFQPNPPQQLQLQRNATVTSHQTVKYETTYPNVNMFFESLPGIRALYCWHKSVRKMTSCPEGDFAWFLQPTPSVFAISAGGSLGRTFNPEDHNNSA
jgi:hypothetical protein